MGVVPWKKDGNALLMDGRLWKTLEENCTLRQRGREMWTWTFWGAGF